MCSCISCSRCRNTSPNRPTAYRVLWCEILFPGTNYSHASTRANFLLAARAHGEQMRCWFTLPLVALLMEAEATINRITTHPQHQSERSLSDSIHLQQISSYFTPLFSQNWIMMLFFFFYIRRDAGLISFLIMLWNHHISKPRNKNARVRKMAFLCMSVKCGWQSFILRWLICLHLSDWLITVSRKTEWTGGCGKSDDF